MNGKEALQFIHGTLKFGSKLGLGRMRRLMSRLGNPQDELSFIHVAGTNGKGSTVTMIANMLSNAGYTVGKYVSPYVYEFGERISINGNLISEEQLAFHAARVKTACDAMAAEGEDHPTEFEIVTAIGFCFFAAKKCDFVVLEVGLGGRFDATNVIRSPLLSVITSISLDHEKILGDTVEKIAGEKCGIIKKGVPTVVYPLHCETVLQVIKDHCAQNDAEFILPNDCEITIVSSEDEPNRFVYNGVEYTQKLQGRFQIYNAITAISAVKNLERRNLITISADAYKIAGAECAMPARFETVCNDPLVIFDASHNPDGVKQFVRTIDGLKKQRTVIIFGVLEDKNYQYAISEIAARADVFIAITPDNPRALAAEKTAEIARKYCNECYNASDISAAIDRAFSLLQGGRLFVCGSFYIMENARKGY